MYLAVSNMMPPVTNLDILMVIIYDFILRYSGKENPLSIRILSPPKIPRICGSEVQNLSQRYRNISSDLRSCKSWKSLETPTTESTHDELIIITSYLDKHAIACGKCQLWAILEL